MTRDEIRQIIWQELNKVLNIVLTGVSQSADGKTEQVQSMLPGAGTTPACPVAFPWGLAARTPDQVTQLILQLGNSPLNRIVGSHFDANRPPLDGGETVLYNQWGQVIYLKRGAVKIGTQTASHPYVLGDVFNAFAKSLLDTIVAHTHAGPGAPPTNFADFEALETDYVTDNAMLSEIISGV